MGWTVFALWLTTQRIGDILCNKLTKQSGVPPAHGSPPTAKPFHSSRRDAGLAERLLGWNTTMSAALSPTYYLTLTGQSHCKMISANWGKR